MPKKFYLMRRPELDPYMRRISDLASEIKRQVPDDSRIKGRTDFRADLAGLLTVCIVANYESCVKETLFKFASNHHCKFADYVSSSYSQLNSQIRVNNLKGYCKDFDPGARTKFDSLFKTRKNIIKTRIGRDIEDSYNQIIDWRHDFAHAAQRKTTIEEAYKFHILGRHVLFTFYDSFL